MITNPYEYKPLSVEDLEAVKRLTRDQAVASETLGKAEVRFVVETYYAIQKMRVGQNNRSKALDKAGEPHAVVDWIRNQQETLENQIKRALERWTIDRPIGTWLSSIYGIGPVLTAGLIAYTNMEHCPSVSNLWSYAGLNPRQVWRRGQKRPWNAILKTLCWKIGQSFVFFCNRDEDIYGKVYQRRKAYEWQNNLQGVYADQARAKLDSFNLEGTAIWYFYAGCLTPDMVQVIIEKGLTNNIKAIQEMALPPGEGVPMLPPGHIQARAARYVVKLFLSHYHEVYFWLTYGVRPALPYVITRLGHADYIPPPNTDVVTDLPWRSIPVIAIPEQ